MVVPVNKVIEVDTTGADVIHSWALPADGREDGRRARPHQPHLVQGRPQTGTFYGQCSELCGARHAFMPIEVKVVSDADYAAWLAAPRRNSPRSTPMPPASQRNRNQRP